MYNIITHKINIMSHLYNYFFYLLISYRENSPVIFFFNSVTGQMRLFILHSGQCLITGLCLAIFDIICAHSRSTAHMHPSTNHPAVKQQHQPSLTSVGPRLISHRGHSQELHQRRHWTHSGASTLRNTRQIFKPVKQPRPSLTVVG